MKLFLASSVEGSVTQLISEFGIAPNSHSVAYISTASNCYSPPKPLTERGSYMAFKNLGFSVTHIQLEQETQESLQPKLRNCQILVIGGGNTFYLSYHMYKSGFDKLLPAFLQKGGIYVGSSAGSCVVSPSIAYAAPIDDPKLSPDPEFTRGLGLVDLEIYPHFIEDWFAPDYTQNAIAAMAKSRAKRIILADHQALVVTDSGYKIV